MKLEPTVKERHRENFAYRLELLMGRHRENPEKIMYHLQYNLKMNVEKGPSCGTWIHGLTKLSEPAKQTPIMIVIIKTLFLGSSSVCSSLRL